MKGGSSLVGSWACHADTRDFCSSLAALAGPVKKFFFSSPYTISILLSPSPRKLMQTVVLGRLSFSMCLWLSLCSEEIKNSGLHSVAGIF